MNKNSAVAHVLNTLQLFLQSEVDYLISRGNVARFFELMKNSGLYTEVELNAIEKTFPEPALTLKDCGELLSVCKLVDSLQVTNNVIHATNDFSFKYRALLFNSTIVQQKMKNVDDWLLHNQNDFGNRNQ
jgi:hypothetical protein